jgi:hypothetical protein
LTADAAARSDPMKHLMRRQEWWYDRRNLEENGRIAYNIQQVSRRSCYLARSWNLSSIVVKPPMALSRVMGKRSFHYTVPVTKLAASSAAFYGP